MERKFSVGIGKSTQAKYEFIIGDRISGYCVAVADERLEPVEFYKATKIKKAETPPKKPANGPPWEKFPPPLEEYRQRGHRRLSNKTYEKSCITCIWGCRMPVEIIIDNWNPSKRKYRYETFCYGPKACSIYKPGPTRKVPGRNGMSYEEEDWIDEQNTEHRGPED